MAHTDSYVALSNRVKTILETNAVTLGLQDVFYGDQMRIPRTPAACVEPGSKQRELSGLPRRVSNILTCYVLVYLYKLQSAEDIREADDSLAEAIETFLHADAQLKTAGEPTVLDSMVTSIESGYQQKGNSLFRAARITFQATSLTLLPSTP